MLCLTTLPLAWEMVGSSESYHPLGLQQNTVPCREDWPQANRRCCIQRKNLHPASGRSILIAGYNSEKVQQSLKINRLLCDTLIRFKKKKNKTKGESEKESERERESAREGRTGWKQQGSGQELLLQKKMWVCNCCSCRLHNKGRFQIQLKSSRLVRWDHGTFFTKWALFLVGRFSV